MSAGETTPTSINLSCPFVVLESNFLNLRIIKKGNMVRLGPVKSKKQISAVECPVVFSLKPHVVRILIKGLKSIIMHPLI